MHSVPSVTIAVRELATTPGTSPSVNVNSGFQMAFSIQFCDFFSTIYVFLFAYEIKRVPH